MQVQLYSQQGTALAGQTATQDEIYGEGLLHAAAHVWIWRHRAGSTQILVQKRAAHMLTFPGKYDVSAAGHVDLGEEPLVAAVRETKEELNLEITPEQLTCFGVHRMQLAIAPKIIENEFQWLYLLQLEERHEFMLQQKEVSSTEWISLDAFQTACLTDAYVPHDKLYYQRVLAAIEKV